MARDYDLDIVCGVLIIHMILWHISQWTGINYEGNQALYFFMPWFFFKSGMYFKPSENYKERFIKDARRLLVPYVSFSVIGQVVFCIGLLIQGDTNWVHYVNFPKSLLSTGALFANYPLWFLLSLFIVKTIYNRITSRISDYYVIAIALAIAITCNYFGIDTPRYLPNCALGLAFFVLGLRLKSIQYFSNRLFLIAVLLYVASFVFPSRIDMFPNTLLMGNYVLALLYALSGIIVIDRVARSTPPHTYKILIIRVLANIGKDSMNYYVLHWIILMTVRIIVLDVMQIEKCNIVYPISMIVACAVFLPLMSHLVNNTRLKVLIGK